MRTVDVDGEAAPIIQSNTIVFNLGRNGAGVAVFDGASATLYDNRIVSNQTLLLNAKMQPTMPGGGLYLVSTETVTVWSNVIFNNTATGDGGGIFLGPDASATIELNLIASNQILGSGAGIYCAGTSRPEVRSNLIADNFATSEFSVGGGVLIGGFILGDFEENVIKSNIAQRGGGIACLLKSEVSIFRNVIAYNKVAQFEEVCIEPMCTPFGAPGILVGEVFDPIGPAPNILNNTIHANTVLGSCCLLETGGVHAVNVGIFSPDWVNNIITENFGWGIRCDGTNGGVRIEFNDLFGNTMGGLQDDCNDPGAPAFDGNIAVDPLFLDPTVEGCNFVLHASSPVRGAGEVGVNLGAEQADGLVGGQVDDSGTTASAMVPAGGLDPMTEVYLRVHHLPLNVLDVPALTTFIEILLLPDAPLLPGGTTLTIPMRAPAAPGLALSLYRFDDVTSEFVDTGLSGVVDGGGMTVTFADLPEPTIYVGVPFSGAAAMPGDVTGDGVVGIDDFLAVLAAWGSCAEEVCLADCDGDGLVGVTDLLIVLGNWSS